MDDNPANWEIAVYTVYILGGVSKRIHTEEIAMKCYELAPESFSWIKYPKNADKEVARIALTDARKEKYGKIYSCYKLSIKSLNILIPEVCPISIH